jgi:hypothetical protein
MSEENNPAEDFLLEIDQETKERAAAEHYKKNRKQHAQRMFNEAAQIIDDYLNTPGKRHFGTGNYAIKHTFDQFSTAY